MSRSLAEQQAYEDDDGQWFEIEYECKQGHTWTEEWSCACDSECPDCGQRDVPAQNYREVPFDG